MSVASRRRLVQILAHHHLTPSKLPAQMFSQQQIHSFLSVSKQIVPLLAIFETNLPMVPFLCDDLHCMVRGLLQRFVKPDILNDANTVQKLLKLDVDDTATHVSYKKVDVDSAAEDVLRQLKVSSRQVMDFRMNCKSFVQTTEDDSVESPDQVRAGAINEHCTNSLQQSPEEKYDAAKSVATESMVKAAE